MAVDLEFSRHALEQVADCGITREEVAALLLNYRRRRCSRIKFSTMELFGGDAFVGRLALC